MILTLALRHLWVKKGRSAMLLLGFALGVGVMIVLLSVGEAMLDQSRDAVSALEFRRALDNGAGRDLGRTLRLRRSGERGLRGPL